MVGDLSLRTLSSGFCRLGTGLSNHCYTLRDQVYIESPEFTESTERSFRSDSTSTFLSIEECRFVFDYDDIARRKALDYINNCTGVKTITLEDGLLVVTGDGLDQDKMKKKLDKIFSPKKGWLSCFNPKPNG